ncbi:MULTISPECIES: ABC transporter ATP-binding protein [Glycomyces]|uniref:ATP-binding cassette domain-containing protein n=2 Tax=Glycomyces TaxID=58113 RepID=A0A9X3PJT9_9ACTN|nr:ABC transporter ATP-binding protein [Glycomyces lechevalierae]MDA1386575.1 ATP-binding cassette domain-containing protein [Glycomyces lechevalierae]MDR7340641.1 energy-coupling factor transport system ATP-binding protein [Glycomyces lechevalierae]
MIPVEFRGFAWRHAGRRAQAVTGVDLRVEPGERVLLLGPSGSGKSTLLAALAGLLTEDSGEQDGDVLIDGKPAAEQQDRVGILFQDPETQLVMARSGDDVAFGLENQAVPRDRIWPRVREALAAVGFPYGVDRPTHALSGGEQQRLALAGVLARRPDLILLDEPTANLDPEGARDVRAALRTALADTEATLIVVEHRVAEILDLVDRVIALGPGGTLLADGPAEAVLAEHGDHLAAQGVWVPGVPLPTRPALAAGDVALHGESLTLLHPGTDHPALDDVSFQLRQGELLAVTGPNGSGKSTLALLAGGLAKPTRGRSTVPGETRPLHRLPARRLATRIGSVFQDPEHQFVTATVQDELAFGPRQAGWPKDRIDARVSELLERLRLAPLANANPHTLSGGEARRLSVAGALAAAPGVLLLDEPTFGQDRRTWGELVDLTADIRDEGTALLAVTHDRDFAAALAGRELVLNAGRIAEERRR